MAHFEQKTTASKARLRSQLHSIIMHAGEKFDIYRSRVLSLAMQLEDMGEKVSEAERVHVLMKGLPNYYAAARDALQMQDSLTVESVSDKLRDVIERKEMERDEEEERANFAAGGGYGGRGGRGGRGGGYHRGGRGGGGSRTHTDERTAAGGYKNNNQQQERGNQSMDETQWRCALCRMRGHWERFCPKRRGDGDGCFRCGATDHQMRDCKADMSKVKADEERANYTNGEYEYNDENVTY